MPSPHSEWFISLLTHCGYHVAWDGSAYHLTMKDSFIIGLRPVEIPNGDGKKVWKLTVQGVTQRRIVTLLGLASALQEIEHMWTLSQSIPRRPMPRHTPSAIWDAQQAGALPVAKPVPDLTPRPYPG